MWGTVESTSQDVFQVMILVIALISVPVMLLVKPLHMIKKMKNKTHNGRRASSNSDDIEQHFE